MNSFGYVTVLMDPQDPLVDMGMKKSTGAVYVLEHRLVVARLLGRPLRADETVHHLDGNKVNNAPENLQLRQGGHGKGVVFRCGCCGSLDIRPQPLEDVEAALPAPH